MLPKKQPGAADAEQRRGRFSQWMLDRMASIRENAPVTSVQAASASSSQSPVYSREKREKHKKAQRKAHSENGDGLMDRIRAWWEKVLKEARKK